VPLKWILGLYPPAWRRRYQEEMLALLEQHHVTWRTTIDLLLGALEARFDPHFQAESGPVPEGRSLRLRRVHSTIFWAFPLLVLGHLLFLDTLDDVFYPWNREHAALWRFKAISGAITAVGFIALMLTGLLLAWTLAKPSDQGLGTRRRMVPLGCFVVALASCALFPYVPRAIGRLFPIFLAGSPLPLAFAISRMELPGTAPPPVRATTHEDVAASGGHPGRDGRDDVECDRAPGAPTRERPRRTNPPGESRDGRRPEPG
jgi:hypothetical protein